MNDVKYEAEEKLKWVKEKVGQVNDKPGRKKVQDKANGQIANNKLSSIRLSFFVVFVIFVVYDVSKFILAKDRPLIETKFDIGTQALISEIVVCGPNMNVQPKCFMGLSGNTTKECDASWWSQCPLEQFKFIFLDTSNENCYILTTSNSSQFKPNVIEELNIQMKLQTLLPDSSLGTICNFLAMSQNPFHVHPDFFNLPAKRYSHFQEGNCTNWIKKSKFHMMCQFQEEHYQYFKMIQRNSYK
ncbi:11634_t:CDS:2, partial [Entrophospora sp. SA101]